MNFIEKGIAVLRIGLGIVPQVIDVVKAFEQGSDPKTGDQKKAAVVGLVQASFDLLPDDVRKEIEDNKILSFAGKVIDVVVTGLNAIGIFKKS